MDALPDHRAGRSSVASATLEATEELTWDECIIGSSP